MEPLKYVHREAAHHARLERLSLALLVGVLDRQVQDVPSTAELREALGALRDFPLLLAHRKPCFGRVSQLLRHRFQYTKLRLLGSLCLAS